MPKDFPVKTNQNENVLQRKMNKSASSGNNEYGETQLDSENDYGQTSMSGGDGTTKTYEFSYNSYGLWDHYPEWGPFHDSDMQKLKGILEKENGTITEVYMNAKCATGAYAGEEVPLDYEEKKEHYIDPIKSIMRKEGVSFKGAKFNVRMEVMEYTMELDGGCGIDVKITYKVPG